MDEDVDTSRADDQHGDKYDDGYICRYLMQYGARTLHIPYLVECRLHRLEERIDGPQQDQQADTDEHAALCGVQIAFHHLHDRRHHVCLAQKRMTQLLFDHVDNTEAFGYGDDHG